MTLDDEEDLDFEGNDKPRYTLSIPESDEYRIELLRIALNFPAKPGTDHILNSCTPTDLDELESILKRHLRK